MTVAKGSLETSIVVSGVVSWSECRVVAVGGGVPGEQQMPSRRSSEPNRVLCSIVSMSRYPSSLSG